MPDQETHVAWAVMDFRSVAREIQILIPRRQHFQRGHVVDHRPVRRRHDRRRPTHHVIAHKKHLSILPRESQMIGGMARRRHGLQRPPGSLDGLAIAHRNVGPEVAVGAGFRGDFFALIARPRRTMRALGIDGGAGGRLDPRGVGRVVAMGVRDQNMRYGFAAHGLQ